MVSKKLLRNQLSMAQAARAAKPESLAGGIVKTSQ